MLKRLLTTARVPALAFLALCSTANLWAASDDKSKDVHHKTLWEQIYEGGWVMVPIGACSVLTFFLCGDGLMRTGRKRVAPPALEASAKRLFQQGDYVGVYHFCKANPTPFTNVLRAGVGMLGEGKVATGEAIGAAMYQENSRLNTYISYLSVIGVCTPMIGLLGTVTGMIKAFDKLGQAGIGDPSGLSSAIGEVLVATASGLLIAIPAFGMFYFLRSRSADAMHHIQDILQEMFRKMPYEQMAGLHISGEQLFAATPNWLQQPELSAAESDGQAEAGGSAPALG